MVTDGTTTTAVYNCPPGYEVKGSQAITCTTDGGWSSSPSDCGISHFDWNVFFYFILLLLSYYLRRLLS